MKQPVLLSNGNAFNKTRKGLFVHHYHALTLPFNKSSSSEEYLSSWLHVSHRKTALNHFIQMPCDTFKIVSLPGQQTLT